MFFNLSAEMNIVVIIKMINIKIKKRFNFFSYEFYTSNTKC